MFPSHDPSPDYGEGRRDFNKLVGTSGLLVALKSLGLGNIGKATKAGDDFKVSSTFSIIS